MITEIEIEGLGILRHLNEWQQERWFKMARGPNRVIAPAAFGLGMSLQQFKRLPVAQQKAALQAYDCLTSPGNFDAPRNAPEVRNPFPRAGSHVPNQKQVELGRLLIAKKDELEHGHFGPWLAKAGVSHGQAKRWMQKARAESGR